VTRRPRVSWKTHQVRPGRYTVVITQDTGPIAGVIEGRKEIVIAE